jgi:hypothetical protein
MTIRSHGVVSASAPAQIVVRSRAGKWHIQRADRVQEFIDESSALRAAIEIGQESGINGTPACVVLLDRKTPKIVWTYGENDYPPHLADLRAKPL